MIKKILVILLAVFAMFGCSKTSSKNNNKKTEDPSGLNWDDGNITVYSTGASVWYPRLCALADGTMLCAFDTRGDYGSTVIKIVQSGDNGSTWRELSVIDYYDNLNCANAALFQLENGDIWLAHRANGRTDDGKNYTSIRNNVSRDGGKTWKYHSLIEEQVGAGGVYEPHFGMLGEKIAVFYANDSLNVIKEPGRQNIEFKTWDGEAWSGSFIASDGAKASSRDGMPVWDVLEDGGYALVIEASNVLGYPFVIKMQTSPDGYDWSEKPWTVYTPKLTGRKAGAPYVAILPDGRLLVSFQTDEDASRPGDNVSVMKVIVSNDKNGKVWSEPFTPFKVPDGCYAYWNGLYVHNGYAFAVTSANYPGNGIYLRRALLD
jgi:hypothetical protein